MDELPKTLDEALRRKEAQRVASNLENLASDYVLLSEEIETLKAEIAICEAFQTEIAAFKAMDPALISVGAVRGLHTRIANSAKRFR